MNNIRTRIQKDRDLREITLDYYMRNLKKLNDNKDFENLDFLTNKENIKQIIKDFQPSTRRGYYVSAIVALKTEPEKYKEEINYYSDILSKLNQEINDFLKTNEKTPKQAKNMVSLRLLLKKQREYKNKISNKLLNEKTNFTPSEKKLVKQYLIASLFTLQPPIRLDYSPMKIIRDKSLDNDKDNYLYVRGKNKKEFIFNSFKTSNSKGKTTMKVLPPLNKVINLWLKVNKTDNFIPNSRGGELSSNSLGKLIPTVFDIADKHITLNTIRHIYITDKIDIDAVKREEDKKAKLAAQMLHSVSMQKQYAKK